MKSKKLSNLNIGAEDIYTSLGQKSQVVYLLEREVEDLKGLRQKYERLKDHQHFLQDKCRRQSKENVIFLFTIQDYLKERNDEKMESVNRNCHELKSLIDSLERELKSKNIQVKNLKLETQEELNYNDQCSTEIKEKNEAMQDLNNAMELLKMERKRINDQETLLREDVQKSKYSQRNTQISIEKVKGKIYNLQNYIRDLVREEEKIN